ncbi:HlyD family type I secretion periplasmic adaptor subunit [Mesorhizobium sp. B2-5-9]|uniref:HlyD family type I secretion periplasmic adaptor subunit n=1 Tax=Mesorhizobium sp. B2-5-9 TaxID=2589921 RepID=UPI001128DECC|nr:HlyD family type I secretion periplasmic adaptor subunit [Mesorhizobium sp. B2-5-9]TPJ95437.1 HlyD family type I secretion periplasmic adaptor subunit [Mesorhizobium sp. B2-5-9]
MKDMSQHALRRSLHGHLLAGAGAIILLFGGFGGWAYTTEISGAVMASGMLTIEGKAKAVQHPTGGVVAELLVQEGQQVRAGDVIIRLDATVTRANQSAISANLNQLYAREARLVSERDGLDAVAVPEILSRRMGGDAEAAMAGERRLFADRRTSRDGQKSQLQEQIGQLNEQIAGLDVQLMAKEDEIGLIDKETVGVRKLYDIGLTPFTRINTLDRSAARLRGERGQLIAQSATTKGQIAETELKRLDVDQSMRADVAQELRDVQNKQAELIEKEVSALDQLKRIDIIAPVSGAVHDLAVHTVGGVVKAGDELMQIVPRAALSVEVKVAPQDIDQLSIGQPATLRLAAFNRNTTPELEGQVIRISADLEIDEKTGAGFYRAAIAISDAERSRIPDLTLVPGMPVEAAIRTGDRTVISYLVKPIRDHAARVFREE